MEELWRDIEGYEGLYQVSNLGRVMSYARKGNWKNRILNGSFDKNGYILVLLYKNNKTQCKKVHRLVAQAFIPNIENKPQVNHIDGNKENNNVNNLEWVTNKENSIHAWKTGLQHKHKGAFLGKSGKEHNKSKKVLQINRNTKEIITIHYGTWEASRRTNVSQKSICNCCNNKQKTAGGYIWKYKEE